MARSIKSTDNLRKFLDFDFSISILDGCLKDKLTASSEIEDLDYYISYTGAQILPTPFYAQVVEKCPVSWSLVTVDDQLFEQALSEDLLRFIDLQKDGSIKLDVGNDFSVVGQTWNLRLTAISDKSEAYPIGISYDFSISSLDGCLLDTISSEDSIEDFSYYLS